jgi:hypothetical protein
MNKVISSTGFNHGRSPIHSSSSNETVPIENGFSDRGRIETTKDRHAANKSQNKQSRELLWAKN